MGDLLLPRAPEAEAEAEAELENRGVLVDREPKLEPNLDLDPDPDLELASLRAAVFPSCCLPSLTLSLLSSKSSSNPSIQLKSSVLPPEALRILLQRLTILHSIRIPSPLSSLFLLLTAFEGRSSSSLSLFL